MKARLFTLPGVVAATALLAVLARPASADSPAAPINPGPTAVALGADKLLNQENQGKKLQAAPLVDDLPFLRRLSLDLIGRIPTEAEMQKFMSWPAAERRTRAIDDLINREAFADRWAVFVGDVVRVRARTEGGAALQAFVHEAIQTNLPYDELVRRLIGASGKAGIHAEAGFILSDQADPMALAAVVSQVFLGVRIQCAQCHDHPFDSWTREEFYDLAAFFGQTRRAEKRVKMLRLGYYIAEESKTSILWPPEDKAKGKPRNPVKPSFPFKLDEGDGPNQHLARLKTLRDRLAAEAKAKAALAAGSVDNLLDDANAKLNGKKKPNESPLDSVASEVRDANKQLNVEGDLYKISVARKELARHVTDPRNRYFSRNIVNRVWADLLGLGFCNPIDDFKDENPIGHAKTLDYLADEFVASGYDFRGLVKAVVSTDAYRRGHLPMSVPGPARLAAEHAFVATKVRRMFSEALFDSIVSAGHLFDVKHREGENKVVLTDYVRVKVGVKEDPKKPQLGKTGSAMAGMPMMSAGGGYDLERGIEVDFKSALKKKDDLNVEVMAAVSNEQLEAEMMARSGMLKPGQRAKYITREVKVEIDDNPKFNSSMRIASPAPPGHFLRVFGQTDRSALDEKRDSSPSMRQALMMLNGKLTNEAARVGPLEAMSELLAGPKADLDAAIRLAYREILTRDPSPEDLTDAKAVIAGGANALEGMADLRWALFNCNEFRYLP